MGHDLKGAVKAHEDALWSIKLAYHRSGLGESAPYIHGLDAAHEAWRSLLDELSRLQEENERLKLGVAEIMGGCVSGTVGGDDVVWVSEIETLWEHCAAILSPDDCSRLLETSDPAAILAALASQDQGGGDRG